jgi:hypothetical protein
MANTKMVHFDAYVPFDWASNLTAREAKCWTAWVLSPSTGLTLDYGGSHLVPNEHGGQTTMYRASLKGREAISDGALTILAEAWRRQSDDVVAESRDIEFSSDEPWYTVRTPREDRAAKRRAKRQVEQMMKGKRWETTVIADGIEESVLVDDV